MSVGAGLLHPRAHSDEIGSILGRHARACRGHLRLSCEPSVMRTWMAGTSPAMTPSNWINMTGTHSSARDSGSDSSRLFTFVYFRSSTRRRFLLQFDLIVINSGTDEIF